MDAIIERIEREAGAPGLADLLAERLPASDLQSLMLEVYRRRSRRVQPAGLLADYESNRFVRPAPVSPRALLDWEQTAYAHLPAGFEALALAPLCPLGTSSAVAQVDPNWSVATARNTEVVSDSTNVLALECALRRRALLKADPKSGEEVHLAASQRLLRAQRYRDAGMSAHFSAFTLCSAGRDRGGWRFELETLRLHAGFYLNALRAYLGAEVGLEFSVTLLDAEDREELVETELLAPVRAAFAGVTCGFDRERSGGRGYYRGLCFHIHALRAAGQRLQLVDGGVVDWTQKLLNNAKERLVISGIGSERLITLSAS